MYANQQCLLYNLDLIALFVLCSNRGSTAALDRRPLAPAVSGRSSAVKGGL